MKLFSKKSLELSPTSSTLEINEDFYYYPKNLRSKSQYLFWSLSDCVIILIVLSLCAVIWYNIKFHPLLVVPFVIAFITARIDDINILTRIKEMYDYLFKVKSFKNNNKPNSSQKLLGGKYISEDGIYFTETGRYVFWNVEPFNLAVLSPGAVGILVKQFTTLLVQCSDLEILALDSARSLDDNIAYLKKRIKEETNPAIKKLLESDLAEISDKSATANNRKYLFILKIDNNKPINQDLALIKRTSKIMQDNIFDVVQLSKTEVKRVLANYFDVLTPINSDYDGLQYEDKEKGAEEIEF